MTPDGGTRQSPGSPTFRGTRLGRTRQFLLVLSVMLPWRIRAFLYRRLLHWQIDATAKVGLSVIDARSVQLSRMSRVGHFSVVMNLTSLHLGEEATVGNWNWMSSASMFTDDDEATGADNFRGLHLGRHASITSRHYLDCSGGIRIGEFTTVGGVRTTILSHSLDIETSVQSTKSVKIGERCFVSSNVSIVPGSTIPDGCVIAMGAVVVGELPNARGLYAGVPAKLVKTGIEHGAYFRRARGVVGLGAPDEPTQPGSLA